MVGVLDRDRLVRLTSVQGAFAAHVLEARLRSEGLDVQLGGALGGVYPFTVGNLARVDVFVPQEQLDDARLVLLADEVDMVFERPRRPARASRAQIVLLVCALVLLAVIPVVRIALAS